LHDHVAADAHLAISLIGFTAGFLIAGLLLILTLRAARLPGTPRANIAFALCGLVWNAGGLANAYAAVSGIPGRSAVVHAAVAAHFSGAVLWGLPMLAIWRSFAVLPWQKTAGRILTPVAYVSAGAISILLWIAVLGGLNRLVAALFSIAICYIALLLFLGAAFFLRRASTPRAVYFSSWGIVGALSFAALGFAAGGHIHAHVRHSDSLLQAAQQLPLLIVLSGFFLFSRFRYGDVFIRYSVRIWLAALAATLVAVAAQAHRLRVVADGAFPTLHIFGVTLLAGALLLSFAFLDARISRMVSRGFFHNSDFRMAARELAERLRHAQVEAEVGKAVEENARRTLELSSAHMIAIETLPDADRPAGLDEGEIVERERTGGEVLVPVVSAGRISHVLAVAPSAARPGLVSQELNYLRTVAAQSGQRLDALREALLQQQIAEAELRALRSQINPHFLFNSLNTIADLVVRDPQRAETMVLRLAGVFRHVLADTGRPLASVREEMDFLRTYLAIEEARFGDRLCIAFDVQPEAAGAQIPSLILQPLVENALKHGLGPKPGPGNLSISACVVGPQVRLRVEDDGMGLRPSQPRGLGLTNVAERLRALYQDRASLTLEPGAQGGTRATLLIPRRNGDAA
jgi:two-component system LytT family sensor kinase